MLTHRSAALGRFAAPDLHEGVVAGLAAPALSIPVERHWLAMSRHVADDLLVVPVADYGTRATTRAGHGRIRDFGDDVVVVAVFLGTRYAWKSDSSPGANLLGRNSITS